MTKRATYPIPEKAVREPLTPEKQALVLQWLPFGRKTLYTTAPSLIQRLGLDECDGWADWFLVEAAAKFDPSKGFRFSTFAGNWVRWRAITLLRHTLDGGLQAFGGGGETGDRDWFGEIAEGDGPGGFCGVADVKAPSAADQESWRHDVELLDLLCRDLPERQKIVVELRTGLRDGNPREPVAVAKLLGISRAGVAIRLKAAVRNMKTRAAQLKHD